MQIQLKSMNVLVTGGSRGIGSAIVRHLADAGAHVALQFNQSTHSAEKVAKEHSSKVVLLKADLSKAMEVGSLLNHAIQRLGRIDVIVNNAGVAIPATPDEDDFEWMDKWIKTMDVNLNAVGLLCKKAVNYFQEIGGGRIINISSRAAFRGDTQDYMAYAASKGGIISLTRSVARAFGKQNIKAFAVAPGFVKTNMATDFIKKYGEDYLTNDIALNRLTEPEDVAPFVTFLASGMADHATGATFDINAGSYMH